MDMERILSVFEQFPPFTMKQVLHLMLMPHLE